MNLDNQQKLKAILRILAEAERPLGSTAISAELELGGIKLKQRMVRNYLQQMDRLGWTENLGRPGRRLTSLGIGRLRTAVAAEKVGFVAARVDELSYRMSFDLARGEGSVVLNVSRLRASDLPAALDLINRVLDAGLGMGKLVAVRWEGEKIGGYRVQPGEVAIGTICSVTVNGVFRAAGIPVSSRFGGLLELREGRPSHFTHIIHYDGTTIDPMEIFLKAKMTGVGEAASAGTGVIGASFREIPAAAIGAAGGLIRNLSAMGLLGGAQALGRPGQPLLDIPVTQGRAGLIVPAGLNAIAAVEEAGIETQNVAMASLFEYADLASVADLCRVLAPGKRQERAGKLKESHP